MGNDTLVVVVVVVTHSLTQLTHYCVWLKVRASPMRKHVGNRSTRTANVAETASRSLGRNAHGEVGRVVLCMKEGGRKVASGGAIVVVVCVLLFIFGNAFVCAYIEDYECSSQALLVVQLID